MYTSGKLAFSHLIELKLNPLMSNYWCCLGLSLSLALMLKLLFALLSGFWGFDTKSTRKNNWDSRGWWDNCFAASFSVLTDQSVHHGHGMNIGPIAIIDCFYYFCLFAYLWKLKLILSLSLSLYCVCMYVSLFICSSKLQICGSNLCCICKLWFLCLYSSQPDWSDQLPYGTQSN